MTLEIIDTPDYDVAHPEQTDSDEPCHQCALAVRPDTGELILLWLCGGINWSISRNQPHYRKHRRDVDSGRIQLP